MEMTSNECDSKGSVPNGSVATKTKPNETGQQSTYIQPDVSGSLLPQAYSKPILILVNPRSGRGKSLKIYKKYVTNFLSFHNIDHEVFVTTTDIRVKDYLGHKDLTGYRSIMVVSGDGLVYEAVNTIMSRPDWQQAMKIPIGIIPAGSGNGLAYTLIKQSGKDIRNQKEAIQLCCQQATQNETRSSDLVKLRYGNDVTIWSFLSIGWGLVANIDIDSEWLRRVGNFRFTIYGLIRSMTSVSYRGRLSFKLSESELDNLDLRSESNSNETMYDRQSAITSVDNVTIEVEPKIDGSGSNQDAWVHIEDKFACVYAVLQSHISRSTNFAPKSTMTDQLIYLTYIRGKLNPCRVIEYLLAIEDGSHDKLSYVKVVPVKMFKFQPLEPSRIVVDGEVIKWDILQGPLTAEVVPQILTLSWSRNL